MCQSDFSKKTFFSQNLKFHVFSEPSISDPLDLVELTSENDQKKVADLNSKIQFQWNRLEQDLEKTKRHLSGLLKYTPHLDRYPDVFIGMQCKITLPKQMKRMNPNIDEEIVQNETIPDLFAKYIGISEQTAGNGTSAYINANRAPSFLRDNAYIATQGPKRETISHFWKMCYNEEPSVIVMLTKLKEEKVNKCDRYWPVQVGQQIRYDCMVVKLTEENVFQNYTRRAFEVIDLDKLRRDHSTRGFKFKKIVQYQYTEWRDRQGSASVISLLDFRKKVRLEADLKPESPMVVHCSAGIGRTGCFIILDSCLQQIQVCWRINVMDMLTYIRVFRTQFIQTHQQYQFVYRSLAEAIVAYLNGCDLITTGVDFTSHFNKKYYANIENYFQQKNLDLTLLKNPPKPKLTERVGELFFKTRQEARDYFEQSIFGSSLIQIYAGGEVKNKKFVKKIKKTSVKIEKSVIPEGERTVQYVPTRRFGDDREYEPVSPSDNGSNLALIESKPLLKPQPISKQVSQNQPCNTPLSEILPGKSASGDGHETDDLYLVLYGLVNKIPIYSFKQNQRTVTSPSRNLDPEVWKNIYRYCWERSIKIIFRVRKEGDRDDVWPRDRDMIEEPHRIEDIDLGDKILTIERFDDYISEQTKIEKNKEKYVNSASPVNSTTSNDSKNNNPDVSEVFEMQKNADSSQVYSKPKGFLKKIEPFKLLLKDKDPIKTKRAIMRRSPNRQVGSVKQEQKVAYWECSIHRLNNDYDFLLSVVRLIVDIYKLDRVKECLLNSPLVKKQSINLGSGPIGTNVAKGTSNRSSISSPANEQNSIPISMVSSCSSRFSNDVFQLQTYDTPLMIWDETETGFDIYLNMIVAILEHLETMLDTPEYLSQYKQYLKTLEDHPPDFLFGLHKSSNISKSFDNSVFHFGKDAKDTTKKTKKTSQEAATVADVTTSVVGASVSSPPSESALNGDCGSKKFAVGSSARSPTTEKSSTDSSLRTTPTNIESEFSSNAEDDTTKAKITPSLIDYSLYIVTRRFTEQYKPWFFKSENDYPKWISQIHQLLHDITSKKNDDDKCKKNII